MCSGDGITIRWRFGEVKGLSSKNQDSPPGFDGKLHGVLVRTPSLRFVLRTGVS